MFISIEGMEGVGKSTVVNGLFDVLRSQNIQCLMTREPGGAPLAEAIRSVLVDPQHQSMHPLTECLLMFASRAQHVNETIVPALSNGSWVLSDRYVDASYAYQGGGRQLEARIIQVLDTLCVGTVMPNRTYLLDAPVELCLARMRQRGSMDRIEAETASFFQRVRRAYLERAQAEPDRICVIDASQEAREVLQQIVDDLKIG